MDQSKTCCSCRYTKPVSAFHRNRRTKDGFEARCKACRSTRVVDPNRPVAGLGEKVCARCVTAKSTAEFSRHAKFSDGLFPYCRTCKQASDRASHAKHKVARSATRKAAYRADPSPYIARSRAAYEADPERWKQNVRKWCLENPERRREIATASFRRRWAADPEKFREAWRRRNALIRKGCEVYPFTKEQLAAKVAYWGDKCWMCHGPWDAIDHVKPLNKGGPHALVNLRPACTPCNTRKLDHWPYLLVA